MNIQYQADEAGRNYNLIPLLADELLAEARKQPRALTSPRGYDIRVLDDGSVFFRNTLDGAFDRLISFTEIEKAARRDFWLNPHRSLMKHIFEMWS